MRTIYWTLINNEMQAKVMWLSTCRQYRVVFYDWYDPYSLTNRKSKKHLIRRMDYFTPSREDAIKIADEVIFSNGWLG